MLKIPSTSPMQYISSIVALNIHSPEGTGDWHSASSLSENAFPLDFYFYGEEQKNNTNSLLGKDGIIDGTSRLNSMGYYPSNTPVWIADHPRACLDYLYYAVLKTGNLGRVVLDEWFPSEIDKQAVYDLLDKITHSLTPEEQHYLTLWKKKNPIY